MTLPLGRDDAASFVPGADESLNFDLIYRNYSASLRSFCLARLGNATDADDACQEAMLKAYRARAAFRKGSPIWPWLATIAANVCIDIQRTSGRTTTMDELDDREAPGPEQAVDSRIRSEIVETAVRTLPDRYRAHVYWRDYEGWSYEEMARLEGTSVASVRTTLMRARRALRDRVESVATARRAWPLPAVVPLATRLRWRSVLRAAWVRARYAAQPGQILSLTNAVAAAMMTVGLVAAAPLSAPSPVAAPVRVVPAVVSTPLPAPVAPSPVVAAPAPASAAPRTAARPPHTAEPVRTPAPSPAAYREAPLAVAPPPASHDAGVAVGPIGLGCPAAPHTTIGQVICQTLSNP